MSTPQQDLETIKAEIGPMVYNAFVLLDNIAYYLEQNQTVEALALAVGARQAGLSAINVARLTPIRPVTSINDNVIGS